MTKIKQDYNSVPHWMNCFRQMVPDFVVKDPKKSPVWEISGAEFSKAEIHTADGISIRFPRVTKIRDDKDWKTATSLNQLKQLFETSKQSTDISLGGSDEEPSHEDHNEPMEDVKASPLGTALVCIIKLKSFEILICCFSTPPRFISQVKVSNLN